MLTQNALQDILAKAGKGGGPGHYALVKALKTKYKGKGPKTQKRAAPATAEKGEEPKKTPPPSKGKSSGATDKVFTTQFTPFSIQK